MEQRPTFRPQVLKLRRCDGGEARAIEVHVEDEDSWQGYDLSNPSAGYRIYNKKHFLIEGKE